MAMLPGGPINTSEYQRSVPEGTPLPPGVYKGVITKATLKETNGNAGWMLEVEFDIQEPHQYAAAGRKFWDRFNIVNSNEIAQRIAKEQLGDLGKACGIAEIHDDDEFLGHSVQMRLAIEEPKDYKDKRTGEMRKGKPQNRCLKYYHINDVVEDVDKQSKEQRGAAQHQAVAAQDGRWPKPAAPVAHAPQVAPAVASAPASVGTTAPWKRK